MDVINSGKTVLLSLDRCIRVYWHNMPEGVPETPEYIHVPHYSSQQLYVKISPAVNSEANAARMQYYSMGMTYSNYFEWLCRINMEKL